MKVDFTLWIWPDYKDDPRVETVRAALRGRGFTWDEKCEEEVMSNPITVETGFEELTMDTIDHLDFYERQNGNLVFCGKTFEECWDNVLRSRSVSNGSFQAPSEEEMDDIVVEELNDSYDK